MDCGESEIFNIHVCAIISKVKVTIFDFWLVKLIRFYYNPVVDLK